MSSFFAAPPAHFLRFHALAWLALLSLTPGAFALVIGGYGPTTNDLYASGFMTTGAVRNTSPDFMGLGYDWTGVAWDTDLPSRAVTLLTPRHLYMAGHFPATNVAFFGGNGMVYSNRTSGADITQWSVYTSPVGNDAAIGRLATPVPSSAGIAAYPVLDLYSKQGNFSSYVGLPLFLAGHHVVYVFTNGISVGTRIGTNYITSAGSGVSYVNATNAAGMATVEGGDSSSPSFIPWINPATSNKTLTLVGAHYSYGLDSSVPYTALTPSFSANVGAWRTNMASVIAGDGYAIHFVAPVDSAWTGAGAGGDVGRFGATSNWSGGVAGADWAVMFDGASAGGQRTIQLETSRLLNGVFFKAGAGAGNGFTITGGVLSLRNVGILNYDSNAQVIHSAVELRNSQNWDGGSGGVVVRGSITNNGYLLVMEGSATNWIYGGVAGAGGLAKDGAGTLVLAGSNTYSGTTFLHDGTLRLQNAAGIMDGGRVVMDTGVLDLNGYNKTFASLASSGGEIRLGAGQLNLTQVSTQTVAASVTGTGSLLMSGNGTLILAGTNSFTGGIAANAGMVRFAISNALGGSSNAITVGAGGGVSTDYMLDQSFVNRLTPGSSGLLALGGVGSNYVSGLDLSFVPQIRLGSLGTNTYGGTFVTTSGVYRLGGGGGLLVISAANAFTGANSLDVSDKGGVTLAASNSYSGGTFVGNGATLSVAADASLGQAPVTPVAGHLQVADGTFQVTSNLTLQAQRGLLIGGSTGVLEVTSANTLLMPGSFGVSGSGAPVFRKNGAGTLALSGSNTFRGRILVAEGTLDLNADMGGAAVSNVTLGGIAGNGVATLNVNSTNFVVGAAGAAVNSVVLNSGSVLNINTGGVMSALSSTVAPIEVNVGGQLNVLGGALTANPSSGYSVRRGGSVLLNGGIISNTGSSSFSVGLLTVSNGALNASTLNVGDQFSSVVANMRLNGGSVNVLGSAFAIGRNAGDSGVVVMTSGRLVTTNSAGINEVQLGNSGGGVMTVSNGTWLANQARVGNLGGSKGALTLAGGTNVFSSFMGVGYSANATGTVNITGGNLAITNAGGTGQLLVGRSGVGALTLNGGTVIVDQLLATNGANSAFTFNGGALNVKATTVTNGSVFTVGNGGSSAALNLLGGTHTFRNGLGVNTNATLGGTGLISMAGLTLTNAGTIAPGFSPGTLSVTGDVFLAGSSVTTMELAATNSFDRLLVSGQMGFGGTLVVTNFGGFTPLDGQSFDLFDFASASGTFAQIDSLWQLDISLLYTQGVITVVPEPSSLILALIGAAAAVLVRRRRSE